MVLFLLVALGLVGFTAYAELGWWGPVDVPRSAKWVEGIGWGLVTLVMLLRGAGEDGSELARRSSPTRQVAKATVSITRLHPLSGFGRGNWCSEKRKNPGFPEVFCLCFF